MEMLVNKDRGASTSTYYEPVKSDYCLCLAIHAPRKEIIEVCSSISLLTSLSISKDSLRFWHVCTSVDINKNYGKLLH